MTYKFLMNSKMLKHWNDGKEQKTCSYKMEYYSNRWCDIKIYILTKPRVPPAVLGRFFGAEIHQQSIKKSMQKSIPNKSRKRCATASRKYTKVVPEIHEKTISMKTCFVSLMKFAFSEGCGSKIFMAYWFWFSSSTSLTTALPPFPSVFRILYPAHEGLTTFSVFSTILKDAFYSYIQLFTLLIS